MSRRGKYVIKADWLTGVVRAWLYDFDIGGATLKSAHIDLLKTVVGPLIRDGGNIRLLGFASTTGTWRADERLGEGRMQSVVNFLRHNFGTKFVVGYEHSWGKTMALVWDLAHLPGGTGDNQESDVWRAVVINAWSRILDPPPPPEGVEDPFQENTDYHEVIEEAVDVATISLGIVEGMLVLGELEALAEAADVAGGIFHTIGGIIHMPAVWATADAYANTNGQIQGAADAIQDMADQFGGESLNHISRWPAVQVPAIHTPVNPQPDPSQSAWLGGQREGLQRAVAQVLKREQEPQHIRLKDGQNIRVTGRVWLHILSRKFGTKVGIETVIKPANAELWKRDMPNFPTHPGRRTDID